MQIDKTQEYDTKYLDQNYFRHHEWIYAPYISSLIAYCGLKEGSSVLDVGCGQGFFSYLFRKSGMRVYGIDLSETGIRMAEKLYGQLGITFAVADIHAAAIPGQFDCIFVRSCSLYNTDAFPLHKEVTRKLLRHLKENGVFIFAYNSNFSSRTSLGWRYHSLRDVQEHFSTYPNAKIFFSNKIDTWLLRKFAFAAFVTRLNILMSEASGMGGDLICILRNARLSHRSE